MAAMTPEQLSDCLRVLALHVGHYRWTLSNTFRRDTGTGFTRSTGDDRD
jgi:hypothetical protein